MSEPKPHILDIPASKSIIYACQLAVKAAIEKKGVVQFNFNGVNVDVFPGDDQDKVYAYYQEQINIPDAKKVSRSSQLDPFDL